MTLAFLSLSSKWFFHPSEKSKPSKKRTEQMDYHGPEL